MSCYHQVLIALLSFFFLAWWSQLITDRGEQVLCCFLKLKLPQEATVVTEKNGIHSYSGGYETGEESGVLIISRHFPSSPIRVELQFFCSPTSRFYPKMVLILCGRSITNVIFNG